MNIIYVMGIYDHFPSYLSHTIPSILNYAESTGAELIFKHLPDQKLLKKIKKNSNI